MDAAPSFRDVGGVFRKSGPSMRAAGTLQVLSDFWNSFGESEAVETGEIRPEDLRDLRFGEDNGLAEAVGPKGMLITVKEILMFQIRTLYKSYKNTWPMKHKNTWVA